MAPARFPKGHAKAGQFKPSGKPAKRNPGPAPIDVLLVNPEKPKPTKANKGKGPRRDPYTGRFLRRNPSIADAFITTLPGAASGFAAGFGCSAIDKIPAMHARPALAAGVQVAGGMLLGLTAASLGAPRVGHGIAAGATGVAGYKAGVTVLDVPSQAPEAPAPGQAAAGGVEGLAGLGLTPDEIAVLTGGLSGIVDAPAGMGDADAALLAGRFDGLADDEDDDDDEEGAFDGFGDDSSPFEGFGYDDDDDDEDFEGLADLVGMA